jgi:hypothetical protein
MINRKLIQFRDFDGTNNAVIMNWAKPFIDQVNAAKKSAGIKHKRKEGPTTDKIRFKRRQNEIFRISVLTTKGDIMTQGGHGKYDTNRKPKPYYKPVADVEVPVLADALAMEMGDTICFNIVNS